MTVPRGTTRKSASNESERMSEHPSEHPPTDLHGHSELVLGGVHFALAEHVRDDHAMSDRGGTPDLIERHHRAHGVYLEVPLDAPEMTIGSWRFRVTSLDTGAVVAVEQAYGNTWLKTPAHFYAEDVGGLANSEMALAIDYGAGWYLPLAATRALGYFAQLVGALYPSSAERRSVLEPWCNHDAPGLLPGDRCECGQLVPEGAR